MKIKKTRHRFSFKAENSEDSKALGKLTVTMSKKEESPTDIMEVEQQSQHEIDALFDSNCGGNNGDWIHDSEMCDQ